MRITADEIKQINEQRKIGIRDLAQKYPKLPVKKISKAIDVAENMMYIKYDDRHTKADVLITAGLLLKYKRSELKC